MNNKQDARIFLRLINDEKKSKRIFSARACISSYDYCPGTASDWGICSVGAEDRCFSFDWGGCDEYATDICKYDYAGCSVQFSDTCESDYASGCKENFLDYCYPTDYD